MKILRLPALLILSTLSGCLSIPNEAISSDLCTTNTEIDTSGWVQTETEDLSFLLPREFKHDPDRVAELIHGGYAWSSSSKSLEILFGHWGESSVSDSQYKCYLPVVGKALNVTMYSSGDGSAVIGWHEDGEEVFGRLFAGSSNVEKDWDLFITILKSVTVKK